MRKKIISMVLAVCMFVAIIPYVGAEDIIYFNNVDSSEEIVNNYITFDTETGTIKECDTLASGNLVIPSEINGVTVVKIDYYAFENCIGITSITLPETITNINGYAFHNCTALEHISIPENVSFGGQGIFKGCAALKSIYLPKNTTSIGDYMFEDCISLQNIIIPEAVEYLGDATFAGCDSIKSIYLSDNITNIGMDTFSNCKSLKEIVVSENNEKYFSEDGVLFYSVPEYNNCYLECYPAGKTDISYTVPKKVTYIGGLEPFEGCNLENIVLHDGIKYFSLKGCGNLKTLSIPDGYKTISWRTLNDCTSLESIFIPKSVTKIYNSVFENCTALTDVYYEGSKEEWAKINISDSNDELLNATFHYNTNGLPMPTIEDTTSVTDNKDGTFTFKVNTSHIPYTSTLLVVLYNNNTSDAIKCIQLTSGNNTKQITLNSSSANKAKIFIWDNLTNMMPLCEAKEIGWN